MVADEKDLPLAGVKVVRSVPTYLWQDFQPGDTILTDVKGKAHLEKRTKWLSMANRILSPICLILNVHSGIGAGEGYFAEIPKGYIAEVQGPVSHVRMDEYAKCIFFVPTRAIAANELPIKIVIKNNDEGNQRRATAAARPAVD